MRLAVVIFAVATLAFATSAADAKHRHHARVVIHPTYVHPAAQAWWYGSAAYPAHTVPLAAYPSPGGVGLIWAPFGWGYAQR